MRKTIILTSTLMLVILLGSCRKEVSETPLEEKYKTRSLKVPESFAWNTTQAVTAEIGVSSVDASGLLSKISLYMVDPATGSEPVATGSAGFNYNFETSVIIPTTVSGLWVVASFPDGNTESMFVPVSGGHVGHIFVPGYKSSDLKSTAAGPDCSTGCDQTISGSGQVTINGGKTYCVTTSFTGSINFESNNGGGTLRVCGSAQPQNINNLGDNCHIVVADGGTFTTSNLSINGSGSITAWHTSTVAIGNLNINQSGGQLINYSGSFTLSGTFSPSGKVENYGTLTINGSYNGNTPNGYLKNMGTMTVSESMSMNNPLTNSGSLSIGTNLNMNANSSAQNQCKINVQGSVSVNAGTFTLNGGYLRVNSTLTLNGSSQFVLQNQSMVSAVNMTLNSSISGAGSKNTIKTTGQATINGNKTVSGAVEWADNDGVLSNGNTSNFTNGATFVTFSNATNYVPSTPCNPEGFGTPTITDSDGDGVGDQSDAYPQDATRAYNNYYPSSTGFASLAYEDLWPSMGDFDMNDLVVDVRFNRVTNAQNKVVDLINVYHVKAVGGTFHNTFAFQLDNVNIGAIASVTGSVVSNGSFITLGPSGLETGTTKPVVVVWDDVEDVINRTGGAYFNTVNNGLTGSSDILTINLHFSTPQQVASVGQPPYNHFIIRGENRGHEIHLPGYIPTSKADASLFSTGDDDTNPGSGKYYKSTNNLPWGIFVAESFSYPVEKKDISSVHLKFSIWAESSGLQYSDWYQNKTGYRDVTSVYGTW